MTGLDTLTAGDSAAAVRTGRASALELCDAAIARIEARDGPINAVVVRDFDRARDAARQVDATRRVDDPRPLLGVPMTVKESYNVAGLPTTWGLPPFRGFRPAEDAVLVARLKAAGAVVLGKTNVPPALADWQTANPIHGRTVNPHDASRSPGGSSGGGAAALAAGMVPLELGSDIGGSIRIPAHFCGVCGHKPTFGLLPSRGHSFPGTDGAGVDLAVCGPLARRVADLELALAVLAGPDGDEATGDRLALPAPRRPGLAGCRLLLLDAHPDARADASIREALGVLVEDLTREGARVDTSSPGLPDLRAAHAVYLKMLLTITTRGAPGAERGVISAHEWFGLLDQRAVLGRRWRAFFADFDALIAPPFGTTAFESTAEADWRQRRLVIDGEPTDFGAQLAWAGIASLPGLPATVVPIATADGLPIGVQLIGGFLQDRTTLALADRIEQLRSG